MSENNNGKTVPLGIRHGVEHAAFHGQEVTRDQIRDYLRQDIYGVYILLADLLRTNEAIEALVEVFYKRFQDLKAAKEAAPPIEGLE